MEVCNTCTRNCFLIHRKNHSQSPKVSSFFKVMFGKKFSEVLFLPPKFAKRVGSYVGRTMRLKDSSGQTWNVLLSSVNGSLAFQKGWHEFSIDHGIEMGDFVVFHYISESSHFVVQIFGRSACEKLPFSIEKSCKNKRLKTSRDTSDFHADNNAFYKSSPKKHPSDCGISQPNDDVFQRRDESKDDVRKAYPVEDHAPSHETRGRNREPARDLLEDVSFMFDRNMSFPQEDDNEDLFDLSKFEMPEKKAVAKEVEMDGPSFDAEKFHMNEDYTFSKNEESYSLVKDYTSVPGSSPSTEIPPSSSMKREPVGMPHESEFFTPSENEESCSLKKDYTSLPGSSPSIDMPSSSNMTQRHFGMPHKSDFLAPSENEGSCSLKKKFTSQPESLPSTDMPSNSSMRQEPIELPCQSELLAPSGSWDWESCLSVPKLGEAAFGLEDPCLPIEGWLKESAGRPRAVKQEPRVDTHEDLSADTYLGLTPVHDANLPMSDGGSRMIVKHEHIDIIDLSPAPVANITCSVQADSDSFLDLSEPLPIKGIRAAKMEKKMVFLHDPAGRTWPVLYHQRCGFKVLASGWEAFRKTNNIHTGDKCTFTVRNIDEGVLTVTIHYGHELMLAVCDL